MAMNPTEKHVSISPGLYGSGKPPTVTFLEVRNKIRELKVANRKEIRSKHQIISKKRGTNVSTALAVSIHGGISRAREMWNEILKKGPSPTKNQGGLLPLEVQTLSQQSKETEARYQKSKDCNKKSQRLASAFLPTIGCRIQAVISHYFFFSSSNLALFMTKKL
ncbi:unnamed protein product [Brassica rapa subsp. narinosa]